MEEQEPNVPRVSTLHAYCGNTPTPPSFIPKVESLVLNHLNWEMVVVTPLHFLDYYMLVCMSPCELLANPHLSNYNDTRSYLAKMAEFLVDLCEHRMFLSLILFTSTHPYFINLSLRFSLPRIPAIHCSSGSHWHGTTDVEGHSRVVPVPSADHLALTGRHFSVHGKYLGVCPLILPPSLSTIPTLLSSLCIRFSIFVFFTFRVTSSLPLPSSSTHTYVQPLPTILCTPFVDGTVILYVFYLSPSKEM